MGTPKNTEPTGCVATSSECVIWNGPDIPFLKLCKGDTISKVTKEIADKVCNILNLLSVNSYDFSCIDATSCSPKNFIELFQQMINEICALKDGSSTSTSTSEAGCPDCEISVASCFQIGGNTAMQLIDYVAAIGLKVCEQAVIIETQQSAITQLTLSVTTLRNDVNNLLNA